MRLNLHVEEEKCENRNHYAADIAAREQFIANTLALATNAALREKIGQDGMRLYED